MDGTGRANLRQIAQALGLSITTVSRALKDGPEVRPDTIARVKEAANALGYVPNFHGRALRTGQTRRVAAILPLETREYLSDLAKLPLIEGMTIAAQEHGYSLSISSTTPEDDPQENLQHVIEAGGADGIVITRMVAEDPRVPFLIERNIPFIAFGRSGSRFEHAYVDIDNERIAYESVQMLMKRGCRRIALQLLTVEDQYSTVRMVGYSRALAEAGIAVDMRLIGHQYTMAASEKWLTGLCDLDDPPDGLICANELGLLGALAAIRRHGLVLGANFWISVRDNTRMYQYLSEPLMAHFVDMVEVGRRLVDGLVQQIEKPGASLMKLVVDPRMEQVNFDRVAPALD